MGEDSEQHGDEEPGFQIPFAYCGLLDDVVARYDASYNDPKLFNRILVKNLIFGGGLYLNDGYLFMHPESRGQLNNPNSVLSKMLETGYVHIFTRCNTLEQLQNLIENSKIPSHIEFRNSPEYVPFRKRWDEVCGRAWEATHVTFWGPLRNHKVQSKLYQRVLPHTARELGLACPDQVLMRLYELLYPEHQGKNYPLNPDAGAARTKYENACTIALRESGLSEMQQYIGLCQLMRLGNEAYHYAFAAILSWEEGRSVAADTFISPAFDEFIVRPEIDYRKFESIPTFGIPTSVDLSVGADLVPLMDANEPAFQAKTQFIWSFLEDLKLSDINTNDWLQRVQGRADAYASALQGILGVEIGKILDGEQLHQIVLARGVTGEYEAAGSQLPILSTEIVKEDGSVMGDCVVKYTVPDEDRHRKWHFTGREIVPQVSSLAFHKSIVDELLDDDFLTNDRPYRDDDDGG